MEQVVCSLMVRASGSATGTVPVVVWCSVMNGSGDACQTAHASNLEHGYGCGYAEGRGGWEGFGTGCGNNVVDDRGRGRGDGNACREETQF